MRVVVILVIASLALPARAQLTTPQIIAAGTVSNNPQCLDYRVVGVCVWMTCTPFGCSTDYSVKVTHRIPDAVVSSYNTANPWIDAAGITGAADGGKATEGHRGHYASLTFKAVDIIGSPAATSYEALGSTGFCSPSTTPYLPYFVSQVDPFWIEPVVESPLVALFAWRKVGVPGANFGSIFPRVGFMHQAHGYKAAALAGQRAADIVTNRLQPHVYLPMRANAEPGYWPPERIIENQPFNHAWQALSPAGTAPCTVFGEIPDAALPVDPYAARVAPSENYAWHLWRRYACCEREGAVLIYHTPI